jgi:hypothetical protein
MNLTTRIFLIFFCAIAPAAAQNINPEAPPDPLNKVFFGARIYPEGGPVRSMQTEVDTVKECIDNAAKALAAKWVDDAKAIEVRCIKERNADKPM